MLAAGDTFGFDALLIAPAAIGAAIGSVARDAIVRAFRARRARGDLGILAANLAACAIAGFAAPLASPWTAFVVAGVAGGLSTWSGLAVEVAGCMRARRWGLVALHLPGAFAAALALMLAARAVAGGTP
jgi:fluoride ion exporter CrcB/FEX